MKRKCYLKTEMIKRNINTINNKSETENIHQTFNHLIKTLSIYKDKYININHRTNKESFLNYIYIFLIYLFICYYIYDNFKMCNF